MNDDQSPQTMYLRLLLLLLIAMPLPMSAQRAVQPDRNINSPFEEREPILSPDGTLYFWRRESPDNAAGYNDPGDIYRSERNRDGSWGPAQRMPSPLNSKGHDFVWQVSRNHDTLFVMQAAPGVREPGIAYSVRLGRNRWSNPQSMHIRNFRYEGNYKDYFLGPGRVLLLPNEGYPSYGGTDLYVCFPLNDTAWSAPVNLGPDINSSGNEDAPYLSPDGRTLYFNSDGYGLGNRQDIFVSRRLDDSWQSWSAPERLPAPINSEGDDFDFQISPDGQTAWWCSDLGSLGSNDIFFVDLSTCEVTMYPDGDQTLCRGESIVLEAGFTPDNQVEYQWYKDGAPIRGGFRRQLEVMESGDYEVVRRYRGCEARSGIKRVRFVDPPRAMVAAGGEVICLEDSVLLQAAGTDGSSYRWYKNNLLIPEANASTLWTKTAGSYAVEIALGACATRSPAYEVRSFTPPIIFTEADTMGWLPILPRWAWTNRIPIERGATYMRDLATGPRGEVYALTLSEYRGRYFNQVSTFFPNGLDRGIFGDIEQRDLRPAFIATDPDGNVIVASNGQHLRKFRPDGRPMWWKDEPRQDLVGLCTDPLGNIYSAGRYRDSLRMGQERRGSPDRGSIFLAKHSPRGELLWLKTFPVDAYSFDFGNALASDCEGNVYLAGGFDLIADFGRFPLRATLLQENFFLAKFTPQGELAFARKLNTERTRVRSGDLFVDCNGEISLLLNREWYRLANNGSDRWSGTLLMPNGTYALSHRLVAHQGDLYASGYTMDGRSFVTKLNRVNNQVIIWQDRGASTTEADLPAITVDGEGGVTVAGVSRGNNFQGTQFDLTSNSPVFVMKYARPMVEGQMREPMSLCGGEPVVLLVREEPGLNYQWVRNGRDIPGATQTAYRADRPGTYQVRAYAGACARLSDPQQVTACGEAPEEMIVAQEETSPPRPAAQPAPVVPESEVELGFGGEPRKLKGRRVKSQEEIVVSSTDATVLVWDHGAVDLDTVSVNLNGNWILQNYGLEKNHHAIEVQLVPGNNYLMLYAHNLGTTPPNTASVQVDDGIRRQTMQLRSSLRNCGMLVIRVE